MAVEDGQRTASRQRPQARAACASRADAALAFAGETRNPRIIVTLSGSRGMKLKFHTLDVFTERRSCGNPLAVVLGADGLSSGQMQTIAREFNLAETIFVMAPADRANTARVRIFTPAAEIPFAGHPTIGCAILLAELVKGEDRPFDIDIRFEEMAGLVPVRVRTNGGATWAQFTAPVVPFPVVADLPPVGSVASALGLEPSDICPAGEALGLHEGGPRFFYVPVTSRAALARARAREPAWSVILGTLGAVGGYLYARGGDHPDTTYRTRMLNPAGEGPEDPATGSAAALLASQLHQTSRLDDGVHEIRLEQGYEMGRPSDLWLEVDAAGGRIVAVRVAGRAVRVMEGHLSP